MIPSPRHYSTPIKQRTKFTCPPQFITTLPDTTTLYRRRCAQLTVKVAGTPQPTVKWMLNNALLRDNERIHVTSSHDGRHKLLIDDVSDSDAGLYTVFAFNAIDETIADTYVSVEDGPPIVSTLFTSIDLEVDDKLCIVVCVKDYGDDYNVKWFRNKLPISKHVDGIVMTKKRHMCSLKINSVRIKDGGVYRCTVTSGKETSVKFNVSITDPEVKVCPRTKQSNGMKVNKNWKIKALDQEDNVHCIPLHVFFKTQQQQQQHTQQQQQQETKQHRLHNMKRFTLKRSKSFDYISVGEMDDEELNVQTSGEFSLWAEDKPSSAKINHPQSRSVSLEDLLDYNNLVATNGFSHVQQKKQQQVQLQKQQQQSQGQQQPQTYSQHEPTFRIKETIRSNCCIVKKGRSPLEKAKEAIRMREKTAPPVLVRYKKIGYA